MTKLTELKQELAEIKNQIKKLKDEGKVDEAHARLGEITQKMEEIKQAEIEDQINLSNYKEIKGANMKIDALNVLNKLVRGMDVTDEEMSEYKNATGQVGAEKEKGGYLIPAEQETKILEFAKSQVSLKDYCDVIKVTSDHGSMPVEVLENVGLTDFTELEKITESEIRFKDLPWAIKNYGDIIPVSNVLLDDEKANLLDYIGRRFAFKSVFTQNKKIIDEMKKATKTTGKEHGILKTTLNVTLRPAISSISYIFTNQTGFDWLDSLTDGNGRPLLTVDIQDETKKRYKGKQIVVLSDEELKTDKTGKKKEFWVGSLVHYIKYFDRKGLLLASSKEAGFERNATLLRVLERFDVQQADKTALVYVEITPEEKASVAA